MMSARPPQDEASRVEDVVEALSAASREGRRVRPVGAGSWADAWGLDGDTPDAPDATIGIGSFAEVVEYEPADLTMTVGAGATLSSIAELARQNAQWLAVDPTAQSAATIGATVATASSGALRAGFGAVRDHVLGLTLVTGDGRVLELGGRVVKNVAGFDLLKLMVGGWGRFGIVTRVTVRLNPLPTRDITLIYDSEDTAQLATVARTLATAPVVPAALRLDFVGSSARLATRIVGSDASAPEEARVLESAAAVGPTPRRETGEGSVGFWETQSRPVANDPTELEMFFAPSALPSMVGPIQEAQRAGWRIRCDATEGLCTVVGTGAPLESISSWTRAGASLRVLRATGEERAALKNFEDAPDPAVRRLVDRLVHAFDPLGVLG